jgi:peptide deformylase
MGKLPKGGKARARASAKLNRIKRQKAIIWHNKLVDGILKWDAPQLSRLCFPVEKTDDLSFIKTLKATLSATKNGLGLAAPQIGILKNAFVYRNRISADVSVISVMINPLIIKVGSTTATAHEGCLSFPGFTSQIERPTNVTVNWKDENWNDKSETFRGLLCVIINHEYDHLFGRCLVGDAYWKSKENPPKEELTDNGFGHEQHESVNKTKNVEQ